MRRLKTNKRTLLLGAIVIMVIAAGLGYWKRRGIRNTYMRIVGIEVPRDITPFGYYGQAVKVEPDLHDTLLVEDTDAASEKLSSDIPVVESLVSTSAVIDAMLTEELEAGQYTFEGAMVIQDPFQISPLTGIVLFVTEDACAVRCTVKGKTEAADIIYDIPAQTEHRVPVVGLYPGTDNTVVLELLDENGKAVAENTLTVSTSNLPETMQDMVLPVKTTGSSAYKLTRVCGQACLNPFAYDCNGDVRWYLARETGYYGIYELSNGHFIMQDIYAYVSSPVKPQTAMMYEMDYLGRAYKLYYVPHGVHHEVKEKEPGGNLLCLTSSMEEHYEDVIVELDRETGKTVNYLKLSDLFVNTYTRKLDWAHLNTVSYQPEDDTILISARNLHSVMKIGWTDHALKWILSDPVFWKDTKYKKYVLQPEEEIQWHYEQHTAYRTGSDLDGDPATIEISVFDNHIDRHRKIETFTDTGKSHINVYAVDEENGSVSLLKQFDMLHSDVCSLAVYDVPSGHIFGMSGIISKKAYRGYRGMNYEFDYETGELLNQFAIGKTFYRSGQMPLIMDGMYEELDTDSACLVGELPHPILTGQKVPAPEMALSDEVTLSRMGRVLFIGAAYRQVSQVILAGKEHTYVYDNTAVISETDKYAEFRDNLPVTLQDMEPDTYDVLCVFQDRLCKTEAVITIKEA